MQRQRERIGQSFLLSLLLSLGAGAAGCKEKPASQPTDLERQAQKVANDLSAQLSEFVDVTAVKLREAGERLRTATGEQAAKAADEARAALATLESKLQEQTRLGADKVKQGAKEGNEAAKREINTLAEDLRVSLDRLKNEAGPAADRTRAEVAAGLERLQAKLKELKDENF